MDRLISIIVPTHNKREDVQKCLRAILDQDFGPWKVELIVIDDGSQDGTEEALRSFDSGSVPLHYFRLEGSGPAIARNEGIRQSKGNIVCMVDDDALPQEDWFGELVKPFEQDQNIVGVEGKVVPSGEDFGPLGMSPINISGGVFLTCNIAYRRSTLLKVGGFDEGFRFPAYEDTDLAAQLSKHGKIAWSPGAVVLHPRRRWSLRRSIREVRFYRSLLRYARRYNAMGWESRATRHPISRTVWSAIVAMPIGRAIAGIKTMPQYPVQSLEFIAISLLQGLFATVLIWPPVLEALRTPVPSRITSLTEGSTEAVGG